MSGEQVYNAMGKINDKYIMEAVGYGSEKESTTVSKALRRKLPAALVAAILALLLMGAGVVAVIYGDSIQSWFSYHWERITGQTMSEEQAAMIDRLSQVVDVSQTTDGVTVTVDSATVGDDNLILLLRVEGLKYSVRHGYSFRGFSMEITPDPMEDGGIGSFGYQPVGTDGDGAALLLMTCSYNGKTGYLMGDGPINIQLKLTDIVQNTCPKVLAEGDWSFTFSLDPSQMPNAVSLPDTEVWVQDLTTQAKVPVLLRDLELTSTGIRFQFSDPNRTLHTDFEISAVLGNGNSVSATRGSGTLLEDKKTWHNSYHWEVPINTDELVSIQIGDTQIACFQ